MKKTRNLLVIIALITVLLILGVTYALKMPKNESNSIEPSQNETNTNNEVPDNSIQEESNEEEEVESMEIEEEESFEIEEGEGTGGM